MGDISLRGNPVEYKKLYVGLKVYDMIRRGIPSGVNSGTGAARPDWKTEAEKASNSARLAQTVARVAALRERELGPRVANLRPPRPLSDHERWRRGIALARARDAAKRRTPAAQAA